MVRTFGTVTIVNAGTLKVGDEPGFCVMDVERARVDEHLFEAGGGIATGRVLGW